MLRTSLTVSTLALLLAAGTGVAAEVYVYPAKGQAPEQQQRDEGECQDWARAQSGFDPATPPPQVVAAPQRKGGLVRGALVGAAVGEIVDNDPGRGAALGGLVGGMRQAGHNAASQKQAAALQQQETAKYEQARANHGRAFAACLESRGYTVR